MGLLDGKKILLTGGTGSLGRAFTRMALERFSPRKIIIFSRDDHKHEQMRQEFPDCDYFLGDIRNKDRLKRAFWGCDIVVHTAALKVVPSGEHDPFEFIDTNINGSRNVIEAAIDCEVPQVVGVSTDKACRPINLYGHTKACMESLFRAGNSYNLNGVPCLSAVRYPNVLGSQGSVIPLFLRQKPSGTLTVTDPAMTRFCIEIEQAVELIWSAIEANTPGLYFPKDLAAMAVGEMASVIAPGADWKIIGARPGEKRHEVMYEREDGTFCSSDDPPRHYTRTELESFLDRKYEGWRRGWSN